MKNLFAALIILTLLVPLAVAQQSMQYNPDSLTRGLWHLNESAGQVAGDTSAFADAGTVIGTTVVPGRFGNARLFNGAGDYIMVPPSAAFNFDSSSFRIDLWFKTTDTLPAVILRRGLAPDPGYMIAVSAGGHITGMIGDREDSHWPDTLIYVTSDSSFSDNKWHQATLLRDRSVHKLYLYIDSVLAAKPADDNFTMPLNSNDPLTIGRWESPVYPYFFPGIVDEIRMTNSTVRHPDAPRYPFTPDSLTRGLWHLNEPSGANAADSSAFGNTGTAFGTTIVPGRFGYARSFNGTGDYMAIPPGPTLSLDSASFRIDLWFKTTSTAPAVILRRGLSPDPGYMISVSAGGRITGMIGDREDSHWPDTLIYVTSDSSFSDNKWHQATLVRDRSIHKLSLYIDTVLAAKPADDNFTIPLNDADPLTIGRWESTVYPYFFAGSVDEIRITSSAVMIPLRDTSSRSFWFSPDSLTRGLWHFNERNGQAVTDTSASRENGTAYGTTVVQGRFGFARLFNGAGDYIAMPSKPALDLDSASFRIDLWFRTTDTLPAVILRRGLAPDPGYMIAVSAGGRITGMIGDREDSRWPDTLIYVTSDSSFSDNMWHQATLIRDRSVRKLYLYIDSVLAAKPADDNFTIPLNDADPLTIGRWESTVYPFFFPGSVDEVRITSAKRAIVAGVLTGPPQPATFALEQNYPNPFNPATVIRYALGERAAVSLTVYNILGQNVATLVNAVQDPGPHQVTFDASRLASGVYLYRLQAGSFVRTLKLLLIR